jgi:hypothetical protein
LRFKNDAVKKGILCSSDIDMSNAVKERNKSATTADFYSRSFAPPATP